MHKRNFFVLLLFMLSLAWPTAAQIYHHDFGTTAIAAHPYNVSPLTFDAHLSNSSWSNSASSWTSTAGATGQAIRLTTATNATLTLTFDVAANFEASISSFDFWSQRSNQGPQNWTMAVNGVTVGSGTTGTAGAALGTTPVTSAISGLSGTVTIVISLSGGTGNGTYRLDDFTLNGSVTSACASATVNAFLPVSGPQNTLVTINGTGFMNGTTAVNFNGIAASAYTVVSDTEINAYIPAGNASGAVSVMVNGCEAFASGNFTELVSVAAPNYSSDIYISELYDATVGDGGVIELYNGTASPVNLSGYTIRRYGTAGGGSFYTIVLSGIIPPGGIFLIGIGTGTTPCSIVESQHYSTGFNADDEFQLYNNGTLIDVVLTPNNVGYSMIRIPNAVAPTPAFNNADWATNNAEDCSDIGVHTVTVNSPPAITSPSSTVACENGSALYSVTIANPASPIFQWKMLNAVGNWINVPNAAPFSGSQSANLTINPVSTSLDDNQFYCQVTGSGTNVVSQAAQLEVTPLVVPNFATTLSICSGGTVPVLASTSPNGISGTWSPAVISNTASGNYVFTPTAGQCASTVILAVTVTAATVPNFATTLSICSGGTVPVLASTSPNGISGSWSPAVISNTASGSYIFTPTAGQCASTVTLAVMVTAATVPNFATTLSICSGGTVPVLASTSPNGISGNWSPAVISNTASGNYVFTPTAGQCASTVTLAVTVTAATVPNFATTLSICSGGTVPVLASTSPNGISGNWSPAVISNTASGSYVFTPTAGQCASTVTLAVTVTAATVPDFATTLSVCSGGTVPVLASTAPNGISGSWSPAVISNTASGNYVFTPTAGQCASTVTLAVTVAAATVPNFATTLSVCSGGTAPVLASTAPNGISGTWSPAVISNTASGNYVFTPTGGQCASTVTLAVTVTAATVPNFATTLSICSGGTVPVLASTSPNGISGSWSPAVISNTSSGSYVFTPTAGQCASTATLAVTVTAATVPNFATTLSICSGDTAPVLASTAPNGISGSWSPAVISNTASGNYVFTPTAGQCAATVTLAVAVTAATVPNFATTLSICSGGTVPVLASTAPNGISGSWSPAVISNTASGSYVFTPTAGQCAASVTLAVIVEPLPQPRLQDGVLCVDLNGQISNAVVLDTGLANNLQFVWTLDGNLLATTTNSHMAVQPGHYEVTATTATGCVGFATANVTSLAAFTAQAITGADFDNDGSVTIQTAGGSGVFEYQLDHQSAQNNPVFYNVGSGAHTVQVRDVNGCATLSLPFLLLNYPKFFTPNGDGHHDFWNISGLSDQPTAKIYIFDRYGKLLKSLKPSDESGWDGTFNGHALPATDYWFELFYQERNGLQKTFRSHFALKR